MNKPSLPSLCCTFILLFLFFLWACRKEKKNIAWENDVILPVADGTLTLANLLRAEYIKSDSSGFVSIVFQTNFYDIPVDTIAYIPDTTLINNLTIPFAMNAPPGFTFYSSSNTTSLNVPDLQLKKAIIRSGTLHLKIESDIPEKVIIQYALPDATLNNQPLIFQDTLPKSTGTPVVVNRTLDLSNYQIDLRGPNKNTVNTLTVNLMAQISPDAQGNTPLSPSNLLRITASYHHIVPSYLQGYFGHRTFQIGPDFISLNEMRHFQSGTIDFEQVKMKLTLNNRFGIDAQIKLNSIEARNTKTGQTMLLQNNLIGQTISMTRAIETHTQPPVFSYPQEFEFTPANSNIDDFVEIIPDEIHYHLSLETNPMGNISAGNDFIYKDYPFESHLSLEIPLSVRMDHFTLTDSTLLQLKKQIEWIEFKNATFYVWYENFFPADFLLDLQLFDSTGTPTSFIDMNTPLLSASLDNQGKAIKPTRDKITLSLSETQIADLFRAGKVAFLLDLSASHNNGYVKIYNNNYLKIKLIAEGRARYETH